MGSIYYEYAVRIKCSNRKDAIELADRLAKSEKRWCFAVEEWDCDSGKGGTTTIKGFKPPEPADFQI